MRAWRLDQALFVLALAWMLVLGGCTVNIPEFIDNTNVNDNGNDNANGNDNGGVDFQNAELTVYATNTGGAGGMAINPVDEELYAVNGDGIFGPVEEGDDLSTLTPIGATNLGDDDLYRDSTDRLVLAITNDGEFWIGSLGASTLAVVPPTGGDAEPFQGLVTAPPPAIQPEVMVIAPDNVDLPDVLPGDLLVTQETTFSALVAIDVAGERAVIPVPNPSSDNRQGHHIAFGTDGALYTSRGVAGATILGIQTVASDGSPTGLPGTLNLAADTFVALDNGDLMLRGGFTTDLGQFVGGIHFYSAADEAVTPGLEISREETSENDEMLIAPDGRILLSLPERSEIVIVTDVRE